MCHIRLSKNQSYLKRAVSVHTLRVVIATSVVIQAFVYVDARLAISQETLATSTRVRSLEYHKKKRIDMFLIWYG